MRRHGNVIGRRTVVGRIVKESYGAAKQQHTFTVKIDFVHLDLNCVHNKFK